MNRDCMLTTFDNPFDPFEQFIEWDLFDHEKGYNTCSYLARLTPMTDDMTEAEEDQMVEEAIDRIIEQDIFNIYKKVERKRVNVSQATID